MNNPYAAVLVATTSVLVLVFAVAVSGDNITRYLRTASCGIYGCTPSPSPSPTGCPSTTPVPEHQNALQGPREFTLEIDWDRVADAQRFGDTRNVAAYIKSPGKEPYFLTQQSLAGQCTQPDADIVVGVPKPFADCSVNKISDTTPVELLVKVEGASPDGYGIKITGWDNCSNSTTITRDGARNVTASKCSGTFEQWKGKSLTVKVRSTYRNASEILGQQPTCPAGGGLPGETFCPAPTCYRGPSCENEYEVIGTYYDKGNLKASEAYLSPGEMFPYIGICTQTNTAQVLIAEPQFRLVAFDGTVLKGTARQVAMQLSAMGRNKFTPADIRALVGTFFEEAKASGYLVRVTGGGAGTATVVNPSVAATVCRGGLYGVLIAEVAVVGWEVYDIGSSASSYCDAGGDLSGFFKTTCNLYYTDDPTGSRWCWPDWIPF